jgi:hypothetical protein
MLLCVWEAVAEPCMEKGGRPGSYIKQFYWDIYPSEITKS